MATATKKGGAERSATPAVNSAPATASLEFLTYQENGGTYRWEIVDGGGASLAHSSSFTSEDDAARAAKLVYLGASSARFESHAAK